MSAVKRQDNTLWIAISVALVLAVLVVLALTQVRLPGIAGKKPVATVTSSTIITQVQNEEALLLYDMGPLFLPTVVNSSAPSLPAGFRREPDRVLQPFAPRLIFGEYEMKVPMPETVSLPGDVLQAVKVGEAPNPFFAFGRVNFPNKPLSPRAAFLEVVQAQTGRLVLSAALNTLPDLKLPAVDWQPLEMVVAVEPSGFVGEPMVTSGSGYEEVDLYFRDLLLHRFRIGARLPPGFYSLRVGP